MLNNYKANVVSKLIIIAFFALGLVAVIPEHSAGAACAALPTDKGTATATVSIPSTASYRVWVRLLAPDTTNNSVMMQVDNAYCSITVGNSSTIPANQLTWVDYQSGNTASKIDLNLSAGTHSVIIAGAESGVGVDKLLFLSDKTCVPTGDGSNCTSSSSGTVTGGTGSQTQPGSGSPTPVTGVVTLAPPVSVPAGSTVQYTVDGKAVSGDTLDTSKLSPGVHTVTTTVTQPNGTTETFTKEISVKNPISKYVFMGMGAILLLASSAYIASYIRRKRALDKHFYNSTQLAAAGSIHNTWSGATVIQPTQPPNDDHSHPAIL